jgi:hypothetical protein
MTMDVKYDRLASLEEEEDYSGSWISTVSRVGDQTPRTVARATTKRARQKEKEVRRAEEEREELDRYRCNYG